MSKFNDKKIIPRYYFIAAIMALVAVVVVFKAFYLMTAKHDYWTQVSSQMKRDSVPEMPTRGNILSSDYELLVSSLPEYKMYMDFVALRNAGNDSIWLAKQDSICEGLHAIFPEKDAQYFRDKLKEGFQKQSRHWAIWPQRVNYNTFTAVKALPVFRLVSHKGGFHFEENSARRRSFGSLAARTLGDMYAAKDTARFGLELSYDSILRGTNGMKHRRKVLNRYLSIMDVPPIDGADIVTTIDIGMQDLAENAVVEELKEINGNVGVAIVMEVATGDIKAIVNMEKCSDGEYRELKNHAVSDLLEPGSVFKTASMLVALDDGVCDTTKYVDTGSGVWMMHGSPMKDHNWHRGGYGGMRLPRALEVSSNIGVSRIIDEYYFDRPEKFVEGLYRIGLADDLHIPLYGSSPAKIRMPKKDARGKQYVNWSKTALAWMSIGYETQVPPISTLTFYNAIANGGKMMRPRFVKEVVKDGQVIATYPPVVQREQIAKPSTIKTMQTILTHVVSQGLGKRAGSEHFKVAGKTGTAQMSKGYGGYRSGTVNYLLSFCGFFPADNPKYSCIVCIQKSGLPASGGGMSGLVFHNISEGIMAQNIKYDAKGAHEAASDPMPPVKVGNMQATQQVLYNLGFNVDAPQKLVAADGTPVWGAAHKDGSQSYRLTKTPVTQVRKMPDVMGMGARDAVYILERCGVRVRIEGRGKVTHQSIAAGQPLRKGMICTLVMT